jgi:hypothetical protein
MEMFRQEIYSMIKQGALWNPTAVLI